MLTPEKLRLNLLSAPFSLRRERLALWWRSPAEQAAYRVVVAQGRENAEVGVYAYDSVEDRYFSYYNEKLPVSYHGTGDIFASSALGALMRGHSLESALRVAVDFTLECIKLTMKDEDRRFYGVNFEEALPYYIERLKEKF